MSDCDGTTWCKAELHDRGCFASNYPVLFIPETVSEDDILGDYSWTQMLFKEGELEKTICFNHGEKLVTVFNGGTPVKLCESCGGYVRNE